MADIQYHFYECENPDCRLRFPAYEGAPRGNRCPVCRSNTHVVASLSHPSGIKNSSESHTQLQLEAMLDNIRSAWNVGSIFRTCDGIGIRKIYLCGISPTPENPKVGKTALGAENSLSWEHANNGVDIARALKSRRAMLWALEDLPGAEPLFQTALPKVNETVVLIVGNEVCGVDPGIIELCDRVISIPMHGMKQSFNVAIAFAIAAGFLAYQLDHLSPGLA